MMKGGMCTSGHCIAKRRTKTRTGKAQRDMSYSRSVWASPQWMMYYVFLVWTFRRRPYALDGLFAHLRANLASLSRSYSATSALLRNDTFSKYVPLRMCRWNHSSATFQHTRMLMHLPRLPLLLCDLWPCDAPNQSLTSQWC